MSVRQLRLLAPLIAAALAVAVACGNDRIKRNNEPIEVVTGQPGVVQILPGVLRGNPDGGLQIGGAAPYQVDSFVQPKVSKVDILWVIDDSPSMEAKQQKVKDNFVHFIQFLNDQQIDYHLGVTTTDTYDPSRSGKLQNAAALPKPWIDLQDADAGTVQVDFIANASVGTGGSGDEKALLGGMLALTPPLATPGGANCVGSDCFLRPEAQLYTIMISDEEDSSCSPIHTQSDGIFNSEGCDDGFASADGGYGSVAYWSRFYSGIKGPAGVSRVAAITATDQASSFQTCSDVFAGACDSTVTSACANQNVDCTQAGNLGHPCCQSLTACSKKISHLSQWCEVHQVNKGAPAGPYYAVTGVTQRNGDGSITDLKGWPGCVHRDASKQVDFVAFNAHRYQAVAESTGGIAASICDDDYTPALQKLGLQASGLRTDFPLSRTPVDGTLVVTVNGTPVATSATTWQYVKCNGTSPINSIHFGCIPNDPTCSKAALPPPNATVAASYDVNVRGLGTCP